MTLIKHIASTIQLLKPQTKMVPIVSTSDPLAVATATAILQNGGVIAVPTDTVYGLACCATDRTAVEKLYEIKSRNEDKPVAICVGRETDVAKWACVSHLPDGLLKTLLPGPVTLILSSNSKLCNSLVHNGNIGIRIPDFDFVRNVAQELNCPLALTSANVSSEPSSVNVNEFRVLWNKLDGVFDGGTLGVGDSNRGASTIINLSKSGVFDITRRGIAYEETVNILQTFHLRLVK